MEVKYSVLMSVYFKENPEFFRISVESMLNQTLSPSEIVIVCDGKLTEELDKVVEEFEENYKDIVKVLRLEKNSGLANALNEGLKLCDCEYVARMDTDDVSVSDRMECQLRQMQEANADISSGTIEEFETDENVTKCKKTLPKSQEEILKYARRRNPFNHPCVVFKKSKVLEVGGYERYNLFEDYQLWLKMLSAGCVGLNLEKTLLKMRTGSGMYARRGGISYLKNAWKVERFKRKIGFSSRKDYVICMGAKVVFSLVPSSVREFFYKKFLRKDC